MTIRNLDIDAREAYDEDARPSANSRCPVCSRYRIVRYGMCERCADEVDDSRADAREPWRHTL